MKSIFTVLGLAKQLSKHYTPTTKELNEYTKVRRAYEKKALSLDDLEAFIIGLFRPRKRIDYYTYIKSPAWKRKASEAKKRAGYRCQVCNHGKKDGAVLDAHHRTYENLGNEQPGDITVLCRDCHKLYERNKR
jgi:hypothetical protein